MNPRVTLDLCELDDLREKLKDFKDQEERFHEMIDIVFGLKIEELISRYSRSMEERNKAALRTLMANGDF